MILTPEHSAITGNPANKDMKRLKRHIVKCVSGGLIWKESV